MTAQGITFERLFFSKGSSLGEEVILISNAFDQYKNYWFYKLLLI